MTSYKTTAIVLSKKSWRESDLLFSFYTEDFGKDEAVAIGSQKIKSKLVGHLSTLGLVEINFVQGKVFKKLTHAYLIENLSSKSDEDYLFTNLVLEIVNRSLQVDYPQNEIWKILVWAISEIEKSGSYDKKKLIINIFNLLLLKILGYQIQFTQNLICREINMSLDKPAYELVSKIQKKESVVDLRLQKRSNDKLFTFLHKYLQHVIERKISSFDLIK